MTIVYTMQKYLECTEHPLLMATASAVQGQTVKNRLSCENDTINILSPHRQLTMLKLLWPHLILTQFFTFYNMIWFLELLIPIPEYSMLPPVRKVSQCNEFLVLLHWCQDSKVLPTFWNLIGQFKFQACIEQLLAHLPDRRLYSSLTTGEHFLWALITFTYTD